MMANDFYIDQTEARVQASFAFNRASSLTDIRLFACEARGIPPGTRSADGPLGLEVSMESKLLERSEGSVTFAVEVVSQAVEVARVSEVPLTQVRVCFHLEYQLAEGYEPKDEEMDAFREGNAIFHCWPYAREMVSNLSMRLRLVGPPLPMLHLRQKQEHYQKPRARKALKAGG